MSSFCISKGHGMDKQRIGILFLAVTAIFSSPLHPDMLWGPPSIVSNRYEGLFSQSKAIQGVKFTIPLNTLTPNDLYMSRTAPLTSKRCILYIYSTNVGTEYFKHALYSTFFLFKMQFVS